MGYLSTGLNNPIVGLVFFFFKKDSWVFYYIRYCVFENVHVLTLFLKDKLAYHSHLTFFFLRILWTLLYCLLALSIFCGDFWEQSDISPICDCFFCLDAHESLPYICVLITSLEFILVLIIISCLFWTTCTHYIWRFKSYGKHSRNWRHTEVK